MSCMDYCVCGGFTQDDAHIFCTPDQLENEILGVIELAQFMLVEFRV